MSNAKNAEYIHMSHADIAAGRIDPAVQAGWAMGPFFPQGDLRSTDAFEIKNWDAHGVRSEWRNQAQNGAEYILVTHGILTVVLGDGLGTSEPVIERERKHVAAGNVIILRAGQWRRHECTADAQGVSVRRPS